MDEEHDDIGADVLAAFRGDAPAPEPAPAAPAPAEPAPPASEGPARDDHGRFAPKAAEPAPTASATPADAAATPAPPAQAPDTGQPPHGLSPAVKAAWSTLTPEVRADFEKREREINAALEERAPKLKAYGELDQALAPVKDQLALAGQTPATYVQALVAADQMLRRNGPAALAQIAQSYGIDLRALAGGQAQPQAQQPHPAEQRLAALEQQLAQRDRAAQEADLNQQRKEIATFAADPKNLYFENVRSRMSALLQSGQASSLPEAYDMACWADPAVRPLLIKAQGEAEAQARAEAERQRAQSARAASGSLTGAPTPGSAPAQRQNPNASVEDDVREAFAAARA